MKDHKKARMCETCSFFLPNVYICDKGIHMNKIRGKDGDYYHTVTNCPKYVPYSFWLGAGKCQN